MGHGNPKDGQTAEVQPLKYREDLINSRMGARRLTNEKLAEMSGVGVNQVSAVRNGAANIRLQTLHAICAALDLTLREVFEPKPEVATENSQPAAIA